MYPIVLLDLLFMNDPLSSVIVLFPSMGGNYLLEHGQLTIGYSTKEDGRSFPTTIGYQWSLSEAWYLMGPFLSCNKRIKGSVLYRTCVENKSCRKFMITMNVSCQEEIIVLNFPIIPLNIHFVPSSTKIPRGGSVAIFCRSEHYTSICYWPVIDLYI